MRCFALITALLLLYTQLNAQQTPVSFRVLHEGQGVAFATIKVLASQDGQSWGLVSDSNGRGRVELPSNANFTITVSAVGFDSLSRGIKVGTGEQNFDFQLKRPSNTLGTVTVSARRPLMRQEDDKTIVDPEALAASSTNAYEIIEKVPGLFVDADGNIYLNSTTPASVYINGREQRMSSADIATMLKNLPPNSIASIEILRTPSASQDASGGGGLVNVVLKKGVRIGFTGSITLGMNQGRYGNQNFGLNLNNNSGKTTTYLNLFYGRRRSYDEIGTTRVFSTDSLLNQLALTRYQAQTLFAGFGVNHEIKKNWEVSFDSRASYTKQDNRSGNNSFATLKGSNTASFTNFTEVNNKTKNLNLSQGFNLKHKIDSLGSEWTTDLNISYAPNNTDQFYTGGDGQLENKATFLSGKSDFKKKLSGNITLETGIKSSLVKFNNSTQYYRDINGTRTNDLKRSGSYEYSEKIHSFYLQGARTFGTIMVKVGTRMEQTNMDGKQITPVDTSFSISRTDLFPYVYLSRQIMSIAGYPLRAYLVYRRTISRPGYDNLNPSIRFIDPFLYETGNPSLRPQFNQNFEANVSFDEQPVLAVGINRTEDIFNQVLYPADSSGRVTVRTYDNLGKNRELYFRAVGALPPGGKYFFVAGVQYNRNHYEGIIEKNKPLSFTRGSFSIFTYHTLKLTPLTNLSMNGFIRFKGQQQFYELGTFGQLNFNISQQLFNRKLTATLSLNDAFYTNNNRFVLNQGSIAASGYRRSDTRRIGLNLRYNFGFRKKEENNLFNIESPERAQ